MAEDADFVCEDLAVAHFSNIFKSGACKCLSPTEPNYCKSAGAVGRVFAGEPNRVRYKIVHPESEAAKASASAKNFEVEMKSTGSYLLKDREIYS